MRQIEGDFIDAGAQIIWMLQENRFAQPATSQEAHFEYTDNQPSAVGLRVGDAETEPVSGTFENSPFIDPTSNRGFVMIVRKSDMRIVFADFHGNERNVTAAELLVEVQAVTP